MPERRSGFVWPAALRRAALPTALLLGVDFLDEFTAGVPSVGAPGIQRAFALPYTLVATAIFVLPALVALVLEPPLFVLSDRWPRRWFVCGGLAALGLCYLAAGLAPVWPLMAGALAISATASGCGVTLSQAALMDANPHRREQVMTRWTFMGMLGDLAAPALFGGLALLALGWREAFVGCGAGVLLYAALLVRRPFPARGSDGGRPELPPLRKTLATALRNRRLLGWLFGVWLCGLLDELLVAFGALHLRDELGAGAGARSAVLMGFVAGGMIGLAATDRLLARTEPLRLLRAASAACAVCYAAWIAAPGPWTSGAGLFAVGLFAAPLYPLAAAQAYRALPDEPGMVNALGHLFGPASVALPFALGWVADTAGLPAALALLAAQPLGLLALAWRGLRAA